MVSSRTPEGTPNRCPVCGHAFRLESSRPFGDAPCPACGTLLWFVVDDGPRFFDPESSGLIDRVAARLGVTADDLRSKRLDELGLDSIELVEVVMEFATEE